MVISPLTPGGSGRLLEGMSEPHEFQSSPEHEFCWHCGEPDYAERHVSEYDEWWQRQHRECGPDCCISGDQCEHNHLPRCTQCGERVYERRVAGHPCGWLHCNSDVACCGDPDTGDHRVASPGPSRIYGVTP